MGDRLYPERLNMDNNNTDENSKIQGAYEKMLTEGKLTEGKKLKFPKTEEEARDQAVQWQDEFSSKSMSWGEVIVAQQHFEKTAKKFKLTKEFQENGII